MLGEMGKTASSYLAAQNFVKLDTDADGLLTREEVNSGVVELADSLGLELSVDQVTQLVEAQFEASDANADGYLQEEEFKQFCSSLRMLAGSLGSASVPDDFVAGPVAPEKSDKRRSTVHLASDDDDLRMFSEFDLDGDEKLSIDESLALLSKMLDGYGLSSDWVTRSWVQVRSRGAWMHARRSRERTRPGRHWRTLVGAGQVCRARRGRRRLDRHAARVQGLHQGRARLYHADGRGDAQP